MTGAALDERDTVDTDAAIVLASASPRRRDLLRLLGISFSVQIANVNEEPLSGEGPEALVSRLAQSKALAISRGSPVASSRSEFSDVSQPSLESGCGSPTASSGAPTLAPPVAVVLAADTVVVLDDTILGKPADDAEARAMLTALRGRAHRVLTGVALAVAGEIVRTSLVETTVWMRRYDTDEVERYVRSGSPLDKAGAYGIQDIGFRPVERIEGCFTNVVGLPLCEVRRALTALDPDRRWGPGWRAADTDERVPGLNPDGTAGGDGCSLCERARLPTPDPSSV